MDVQFEDLDSRLQVGNYRRQSYSSEKNIQFRVFVLGIHPENFASIRKTVDELIHF